MVKYNGMRRTRDNASHQNENALLVRELITKKKKHCRIGMEGPYGTVCEHVRSASLSLNLFCFTAESLEGRLEITRLVFLRSEPFRSPLINQPAIHIKSATVAYGQGHEVLLFPFYEYGITSP